MANIEIKELKDSEIEVTGTIPIEDFESHRAKAAKKLSANIEIQGFRKGHVPDKILMQKIGEDVILEEMADLALREEYPKIMIKNKIDAIGSPEVSITKIAKGNPLEFKIKVAVMPEVTLADYKAIAKKVMAKKVSIKVEDKEIEDTVMEIRKMRTKATDKQQSGDSEQKMTDNKKGGEEKKLPELDDEFVKTLGDFKDVGDFRKKLTENIKLEKERKVKDKKKAEVMEDLIKDSKILLPNIMVESELDKMMSQFKDDVARTGGAFDEYLKHIKKTEEDMRRQWRTDAEKRAKSQLILNKITLKENIIAPKEDVEKQVKHLLEHYKDANPDRARIYVETLLTNEKVFEFLENQK